MMSFDLTRNNLLRALDFVDFVTYFNLYARGEGYNYDIFIPRYDNISGLLYAVEKPGPTGEPKIFMRPEYDTFHDEVSYIRFFNVQRKKETSKFYSVAEAFVQYKKLRKQADKIYHRRETQKSIVCKAQQEVKS